MNDEPQTILRECPFCGGEAQLEYNGPNVKQIQHAIAWGDDYDCSWYGQCTFCHATGGEGSTQLIATQNWNGRHHEAG